MRGYITEVSVNATQEVCSGRSLELRRSYAGRQSIFDEGGMHNER